MCSIIRDNFQKSLAPKAAGFTAKICTGVAPRGHVPGEPVWGLTGATGSSQKKRIPFAALRAKDRALCVLCAFASSPAAAVAASRTFSLHGLAGSRSFSLSFGFHPPGGSAPLPERPPPLPCQSGSLHLSAHTLSRNCINAWSPVRSAPC
jgi:hypothetical protein